LSRSLPDASKTAEEEEEEEEEEEGAACSVA
jgi:hypothetical protein